LSGSEAGHSPEAASNKSSRGKRKPKE